MPDLVAGPALVTEQWMLAVPAGHRLARRKHLTVEDLARLALVRLPDAVGGPPPVPDPSGTPAATIHEALAMVGAGQAVLPVGAHARRYHPRPDVAYVPLHGVPLLEWGLTWSATAATSRVLAFAEAARTLTRPSPADAPADASADNPAYTATPATTATTATI